MFPCSCRILKSYFSFEDLIIENSSYKTHYTNAKYLTHCASYSSKNKHRQSSVTLQKSIIIGWTATIFYLISPTQHRQAKALIIFNAVSISCDIYNSTYCLSKYPHRPLPFPPVPWMRTTSVHLKCVLMVVSQQWAVNVLWQAFIALSAGQAQLRESEGEERSPFLTLCRSPRRQNRL